MTAKAALLQSATRPPPVPGPRGPRRWLRSWFVRGAGNWQAGFLFVLALTLAGFFVLRDFEDQGAESRFQDAAADRIDRFQNRLEHASSNLVALGAVLDLYPHLTPREFATLTAPLVGDGSFVGALEWVPRVTEAERPQFLRQARAEVDPAFEITRIGPDGTLLPAEHAGVHYPVYLMNPPAGNERARGFDLNSHPERRAPLLRAIQSGQITASERIVLVQETREEYGFLLLRPVYREGRHPPPDTGRDDDLLGIALGVYPVRQLIDGGENSSPALDMVVFDREASPGKHLIYPKGLTADSPDALPPGRKRVENLQVAGHGWTVVCQPRADSYPASRYTSLTALCLGLLASVFWALHLRHRASHLAQIERTVAERTRQLAQEKAFGAAILDIAGSLIMVINARGEIVRFNKAAEAFTGYALRDVARHPYFWKRFLLPEEQHQVESAFRRVMTETRNQDYEMYWVNRRGEKRLFSWSSTTLASPSGRTQYLVTIGLDITRRKAAEDELRELASTDFLTGLLSRRAFITRLEEELARMGRYPGHTAALLMLDLDYFKQVNDRYGHGTGDALLQHFAGLVLEECRRVDGGGRLGGEEFAILLPGADRWAAQAFAERLRARVETSPLTDQPGITEPIPFSVSIGLTCLSPQDGDASPPLSRADRALYRAKANGRNRVEVADEDREVGESAALEGS